MTKEKYAEYCNRVDLFKELEKLEVHSQVYDEDGDTKEPSFSWGKCECCNSTLGGDRYTITGGPIRGQHFEYEICVDCLYFLEYGKLDDLTMLGLVA